MTFDRILVPIHTQFPSSKILPHIARLALRMNRPIYLLKIMQGGFMASETGPSSEPIPFQSALPRNNWAEEVRQAFKHLQQTRIALRTLTGQRLEVKTELSQQTLIQSLAGQGGNPLLLIPQQDSPSDFVNLFAKPLTSRLLRELNLPIMILPPDVSPKVFNRILYLCENPAYIEPTTRLLDQLDQHHLPHVHIVLSYSGTNKLHGWDRANLGAELIREISYPRIGLEVRGEKDLFKIASDIVRKEPLDLVAVHFRELNVLLESFYMTNPAEKLAYELDLPLLILPGLEEMLESKAAKQSYATAPVAGNY
jgi:hypothetical protein